MGLAIGHRPVVQKDPRRAADAERFRSFQIEIDPVLGKLTVNVYRQALKI